MPSPSMFRTLPDCIFNDPVISSTLQYSTRTRLPASLICICHHERERFSTCTLRQNLANGNFVAIRFLIGGGGTITIGLPTFLMSILSRNAPFCQRRSVNIRFAIRVLAQTPGVCVLSSQPWDRTTRRKRTPFFPTVQPTPQLLAGCN